MFVAGFIARRAWNFCRQTVLRKGGETWRGGWPRQKPDWLTDLALKEWDAVTASGCGPEHIQLTEGGPLEAEVECGALGLSLAVLRQAAASRPASLCMGRSMSGRATWCGLSPDPAALPCSIQQAAIVIG